MDALQEATGARVAFLTRLGDGVLPTPTTVVQEGDLVHFVVRTDAVPAVERRLSRPPDPR
jgi:trk system potassium uptake protein TrkA